MISDPAAEPRAKSAGSIFLLQKDGGPKNTGAVQSGDAIKIVGIYAVDGWKSKAGVMPNGRFVIVENSSRVGAHDLSKELTHYDVFVAAPEHPSVKTDRSIFTIKTDKGGVVYAQDKAILVNKAFNRPLCTLVESRHTPAGRFGEMVAVKGAEKDPTAQLSIKLVDIDALSDKGRADLKSALSALLKSGLFVLDAPSSPGNSPFRFNPALHGGRLRALFNADKWKFAEANEGYTVFDVSPNGGSVKVVFSPAPKNDDEAYVIIIGDEKIPKPALPKALKIF